MATHFVAATATTTATTRTTINTNESHSTPAAAITDTAVAAPRRRSGRLQARPSRSFAMESTPPPVPKPAPPPSAPSADPLESPTAGKTTPQSANITTKANPQTNHTTTTVTRTKMDAIGNTTPTTKAGKKRPRSLSHAVVPPADIPTPPATPDALATLRHGMAVSAATRAAVEALAAAAWEYYTTTLVWAPDFATLPARVWETFLPSLEYERKTAAVVVAVKKSTGDGGGGGGSGSESGSGGGGGGLLGKTIVQRVYVHWRARVDAVGGIKKMARKSGALPDLDDVLWGKEPGEKKATTHHHQEHHHQEQHPLLSTYPEESEESTLTDLSAEDEEVRDETSKDKKNEDEEAEHAEGEDGPPRRKKAKTTPKSKRLYPAKAGAAKPKPKSKAAAAGARKKKRYSMDPGDKVWKQ